MNRWTALYKTVLKPEAQRRRGQVGDLRSDGTLLEFEQVADALERSRLAHRAAAATGIGDTAPLTLRVAIHQGTYLGRVAIAHYARGNMPEAIRCAHLCRDENPGCTANLGISLWHSSIRAALPIPRSDAPGTRIPACDLRTSAPVFPAA